jgi:hypothetical protein
MTRYLWTTPRATIEGNPDLADAIDSALVGAIYDGTVDHLLGPPLTSAPEMLAATDDRLLAHDRWARGRS